MQFLFMLHQHIIFFFFSWISSRRKTYAGMIEDRALSWWRFEWLLHVQDVAHKIFIRRVKERMKMTTMSWDTSRFRGLSIVCNFSEAKLTNYGWFLVTLCNIYQLSVSVIAIFLLSSFFQLACPLLPSRYDIEWIIFNYAQWADYQKWIKTHSHIQNNNHNEHV